MDYTPIIHQTKTALTIKIFIVQELVSLTDGIKGHGTNFNKTNILSDLGVSKPSYGKQFFTWMLLEPTIVRLLRIAHLNFRSSTNNIGNRNNNAEPSLRS